MTKTLAFVRDDAQAAMTFNVTSLSRSQLMSFSMNSSSLIAV